MVRMQLVIVVLAFVVCGSNAEARGRRSMYQPVYQQYYNTTVPTNVITPTTTAVQATSATQAVTTIPATGIVQANATAPDNTVVPANATTTEPAAASTPKVVAVGSAQWKAEQSARACSVQHIGGGFGGGRYEGNGYGATADQAIRNSCYWGQLTPIEIGVARGANGYYATIFYR